MTIKKVVKIFWEQTFKQTLAWEKLWDNKITEIIFGGGAGGGKSFLGCCWLTFCCIHYPGTRWLMGRAKLKTLKETTLNTFFDVCSKWGLVQGVDYKYNEQSSKITFKNGSVIMLKDLFYYPSDPNFDSLGSLEITGAFVDEVNQINYKAWETIKTRIRYKLKDFCVCGHKTANSKVTEHDENGEPCEWLCGGCGKKTRGLTAKLLGSCNPSKNWVYKEFYKPAKDKTLEVYRFFIQSLATDNKFLSKDYIKNLMKSKIKSLKERLLFGNWEYNDDPSSMFEYEVILNLFKNDVSVGSTRYITGDVARKGRDRMVVMLWEGWVITEIYILPYEIKKDTTKSAQWIMNLAGRKKVRRGNICLDEDGVGGGVVDQVDGCIGFINNSSAIQPEEAEFDPSKKVNYSNLKTQCYDVVSQKAENGEMAIKVQNLDPDIKDLIVEELEQAKLIDIDKDGKIKMIDKDTVKKLLGRSPDFSDTIAMRGRFELMTQADDYNIL